MTEEVLEQTQATVDVTQPIIVDLGKQRPKRIKALKRGNGKLWDEVAEVLDEVKANLGEDASGKLLVPVILVYRRQNRRNRRGAFPLLPGN
jgi:hypothetical protein